MADHIDVHVEPVTAENLRKFAGILEEMAQMLEPKATPVPVDAGGAGAHACDIVAELRTFAMNMRRDDSDARSDDLRYYYEAIEGYADRLDEALATPAPVAGNALDPETVEACARALVDKLDLIGPDPGGAFTMLEIHGMPYRGPHYGDELKALKAALSPGKTGSAGVGEG